MTPRDKFKIINEKTNLGVWLSEREYLNLIKICRTRNHELYNKLVTDYEYLTNSKFDLELIGVKTKNERN